MQHMVSPCRTLRKSLSDNGAEKILLSGETRDDTRLFATFAIAKEKTKMAQFISFETIVPEKGMCPRTLTVHELAKRYRSGTYS